MGPFFSPCLIRLILISLKCFNYFIIDKSIGLLNVSIKIFQSVSSQSFSSSSIIDDLLSSIKALAVGGLEKELRGLY